jgi:glycine/D-amino acid oxidase-like deaminating enzyme
LSDPQHADVVIVGGGVIGCCIAYYLTLGGARVTLVERGQLASGASGVAAGMLAPQVEAPFADPFF